MLRTLFLLAVTAIATFAQTAAPVAPVNTTNYPSYFVSAGGAYTRGASPNAAEGWISGSIQMGDSSPYYSITTVDMTSSTSTIRTGFARIFSQSGNFTLMGRIDAGISTVSPIIGSFSGGAIVLYNMKGFSAKWANTYLLGEVRLSGATSTTTAAPNQVTPGFYFGIGRSF